MVRAAGWQQARRHAGQALLRARLDGRNHRQQHGFLSICRLASDRLPRHPPPFSASGGSVRFCRGAVDHMNVATRRVDQGFKQSPPYSFGRPAVETVVDGCRRSVADWAILPSAARSQDMDDPADDPAVVSPMRAGLVGRKQRRNHRPLLIIKPKFSRHDPKLPLLRK